MEENDSKTGTFIDLSQEAHPLNSIDIATDLLVTLPTVLPLAGALPVVNGI
jgi:hypothetical protein